MRGRDGFTRPFTGQANGLRRAGFRSRGDPVPVTRSRCWWTSGRPGAGPAGCWVRSSSDWPTRRRDGGAWPRWTPRPTRRWRPPTGSGGFPTFASSWTESPWTASWVPSRNPPSGSGWTERCRHRRPRPRPASGTPGGASGGGAGGRGAGRIEALLAASPEDAELRYRLARLLVFEDPARARSWWNGWTRPSGVTGEAVEAIRTLARLVLEVEARREGGEAGRPGRRRVPAPERRCGRGAGCPPGSSSGEGSRRRRPDPTHRRRPLPSPGPRASHDHPLPGRSEPGALRLRGDPSPRDPSPCGPTPRVPMTCGRRTSGRTGRRHRSFHGDARRFWRV
jgi:hypothetical protein